jgi:hypothetical protein
MHRRHYEDKEKGQHSRYKTCQMLPQPAFHALTWLSFLISHPFLPANKRNSTILSLPLEERKKIKKIPAVLAINATRFERRDVQRWGDGGFLLLTGIIGRTGIQSRKMIEIQKIRTHSDFFSLRSFWFRRFRFLQKNPNPKTEKRGGGGGRCGWGCLILSNQIQKVTTMF